MTGPNSGAPQIVLAIPAEVINLLRGIQSSLQRIEAEIREAKQRMAWARSATSVERPSLRVVEPGPDSRDDVREMARERTAVRSAAPMKPNQSTHTPKGPDASKRMKSLLARTGLSGVRLAAKLGTHQTTVSMIVRQRLGISQRLDEAMTKLEKGGAA